MAEVKPFRAVRYGERAGPLETLVAPPYDVISPEQRDEFGARSPYNVVHLTLPDDEAEAAHLWADWRAEGVLAEDGETGCWWLSQDYVGPDGVARTREGLVAALRAEPYEKRIVLPHERTHSGPKEGRLRRLPPGGIDAAFAGRRLLIADGHHRYETALAYHEETGTPESAYLLAVLVSLDDPGLMIFPTPRLFRDAPAEQLPAEERTPDAESALRALNELPRDRAAAVVYRAGEAEVA